MDTEIVEMSLPDGTPMLVRAELIGTTARGEEEDDGASDIGIRQIFSFSQITNTVRGVATELHKALEAVSPDLVSVELGFDMAIKGSQVIALIADAGAHASIKVRLEWRDTSGGEAGAEPADEPNNSPTGES
jgi:Trypsin-co-occurring domain 1